MLVIRIALTAALILTLYLPAGAQPCTFGAGVPNAVQDATCSITVRASGNPVTATYEWHVTVEAAALIGMVAVVEEDAVASAAFLAAAREIPYTTAVDAVAALEDTMELLWELQGHLFTEPPPGFLWPGMLIHYDGENIASVWLDTDDGEAAMMFYANPLLRMR